MIGPRPYSVVIVAWSSAVLALLAFILMEPITAAVHRWIMHGLLESLHRSHHQRASGVLERNDWFPVMFAAIVVTGLALGFNVDSFWALVPVGVGVTVYGVCYALVHDVYIHRRLGGLGGLRIAVLDRLADAHRIHHLYGEAPYGMLLPVVPTELGERAARTTRNPLVDA